MPYCTSCGHQNPDDARFCSQCGTRLVAAAGDATATMTNLHGAVSEPARERSEERPEERTDERAALSDEDAAAVDALPPGSALLVVQRGPSAGARFLLDEDLTTSGRHPDTDIFLDDVTVSRRHAEFRRGPEGFRVRDVGSLNGTYVNRDRVEEALLQGGDEVQIGKFRLVFFASPSGSFGRSDQR